MKLKFNGFLVLLVVLVAQLTFAQERSVSGIVSDNAGMPLPGVSVLVKGTKNGTQSDFDGKYTIKAAPSDVLVFSYVGMKSSEKSASSTTVNVKLASDATQLESVVVTAMGIKKQKRSLGYATANVGAKDLTEVANVNVFESLSGKVAGVDITAPAQPGASSKVIIRGFNSLTSSSPLYVVDGTPINNSSNGGTGINRSFDAGNGVSDLDPNNIESMSILKGAAASALYGSRAANGVILITTKSAKNKSKITVDVVSSSDFSEVGRLPHFQNEFGQGWSGKSWSNNQPGNTASNENGSWGPAFNGEIRPWGSIVNNSQQIKPYVALEDNLKDFYDKGTTFSNSVRVSGGGENSNFSLSYSDVNSDGIIPTDADAYKRKTFGLNAGITDNKFSIKTSINYIRKNQNAVNTGQGQASGEGSTLSQELLQMPTDISIVDLKDYTNNPFNNNSNFFTPYADNPYWVVNENSTKIDGNRFFGNVNFTYKINDKFSASYQGGGDYRIETIKSYGAITSFNPGSAQALAAAAPVVGGVTESTNENTEFDNNINLTYNTKIAEDFGINALIGYNSNERKASFLQATITNLDIPNFYELSNSSLKPVVAQGNSIRKSYAVYGSLEASYKNILFMTLTGRNDWTSTLPQGNNSYFYPSVALSGIVLDTPEYFLKLRAGYAQIANDTAPYQTESALTAGNAVLGFGNILLPIGGVNGYEYAGNLGNSDLKPEITNEFEVGFETALFSKRVNLDVSVYKKDTEGVLFSRPLPTSTGYTSQTSNIVDIENKGIEVALNIAVIQGEDFKWDFATTFTKNINEVTDIVGGVNKLLLASNYGVTFNAVKGQPLGDFSNFVPRKNDAGQYIVNAATGYYEVTADEQSIGNAQRDFVMGFKNKFTYKNLVLAFGIDWKEGGEMYSYTKRLSHFTGNGIETVYNDRNTFVIPNSVNEVFDANGNVTGYTENSTAVSFESITDFYNTSNNAAIENTHVIDKTFVRLRDLSLTYNAPSSFSKKMGLVNAAISIYGKNLALWTPDGNAYIDPELSTFGSGLLSEQGEFGTNPAQVSYGASLKLTF